MPRRSPSFSILLGVLALIAIGIVWISTFGIDGPAASGPTSPVAEFGSEAQAIPADPSLASPPGSDLPARSPETPASVRAESPQAHRESAAPTADDLELRDALWVEGRVIIPRGTPADEVVHVIALGRKFGSRPPHRVAIDADGAFRVAFPPGTGTGWLMLDATYLFLPTDVTLSPSTMKSGTELLPELGGCVRGSIVLPPKSEDLKQLLVGAALQIGEPTRLDLPHAMHRARGGASIDANLDFHARGIPAGEQIIELHVPGAVQTSPTKVLVERGRIRRVVIELTRSASISGSVVDPDGAPIPGASVQAEMGEGSRLGDMTDPQGRFDLKVLPPGAVMVSAQAEGRFPSGTERFNLSPGQSIEEVRIVLRPGARIAGRVLAPDGSGLRAVVVLTREDGALQSPAGKLRAARDCRTTGTGRFEFTTLQAGTYRLEAMDGKARRAALDFDGSIRSGLLIVEGGSIDDVELRLPGYGRVEGLVRGPDGKGMAGALVLARGKDWRIGDAPEAIPRTDREGRFAIEGLPLGEVSITAVNPSCVAATEARALVRSGEKAEVELELVPGTRVRFTAIGGTEIAQDPFDVVARDERGREWTLYPGWILSPSSASDEELADPSYGPLPPGRYVFVVTTWDGKSWRGSADVRTGSEVTVTMELDP